MLNPLGGAMLMKSIGLFLQSGRRASQPQAHALVRQTSKPAVSARPTSTEQVKRHAGKFQPRSAARAKSGKTSKKKAMEEKKKSNTASINKSTPKLIENLKKKTHFSRYNILGLHWIFRKVCMKIR